MIVTKTLAQGSHHIWIQRQHAETEARRNGRLAAVAQVVQQRHHADVDAAQEHAVDSPQPEMKLCRSVQEIRDSRRERERERVMNASKTHSSFEADEP